MQKFSGSSKSLTQNYCVCVCVCTLTQSCPVVCNLMDYSQPGSSVLGISQARILEGVAVSSSRRSSQPRDRTCVSWLEGRFSYTAEPLGDPLYDPTSLLRGVYIKVLKAGTQTDPYLPMYIAVLFIIANRMEIIQMSINRWMINTMWYIRTVGYYSTLQRKKILMYCRQ